MKDNIIISSTAKYIYFTFLEKGNATSFIAHYADSSPKRIIFSILNMWHTKFGSFYVLILLSLECPKYVSLSQVKACWMESDEAKTHRKTVLIQSGGFVTAMEKTPGFVRKENNFKNEEKFVAVGQRKVIVR